MKIKLFLALLVAGALTAGAQSQGYKDGIEYYKAGQYENAKTILNRTLNDASTDRALAEYYLGQVDLAQKNVAAAKSHFDAGVAANPECAYNYVGLGAVQLLNGNAKAAEESFKTAQKYAKKDSELTVAIARAYYNADPVAYAREIEKYITKARKESKNTEPAIYVLEGDMLFDQENWGEAAARYEMAITYDNTNPEGYVKFANSYFRVNPEFAIRKLEELLAQTPNSALAQRELAEKYYEGNHWKKASEQYGKYIQNPNHFPEDEARYSVLLYYGEKYPESLKVANGILAQDPSHFLMQRLRFLNQVALGDYQTAADNAAKFFANNPNGYFTTNDYTTYAEALTALGQDSLAVVQYELAVKNDPENADLLKNLSAVYANNKDYVKSAEAYDAYFQMQENPTLNDYFGMSGRYLNAAATTKDNPEQRVQAADRGLEYIDKAIAGAEPMAALYQRKARLYIARNNNAPDLDAINTYGQMIELLDQDPANMDPTNPNNQLPLYNEAYNFYCYYYMNVDRDQDKAAEYMQKLEDVKTLMKGGE